MITVKIEAHKRIKRCSKWSRTPFPFNKIGKTRRVDIELSHVNCDGSIRVRTFSKSPGVSPNVLSYQAEKVSMCDTLEHCFMYAYPRTLSMSVYFHTTEKYKSFFYVIEIEYDNSETPPLVIHQGEYDVANHHWESSKTCEKLQVEDFEILVSAPKCLDIPWTTLGDQLNLSGQHQLQSVS